MSRADDDDGDVPRTLQRGKGQLCLGPAVAPGRVRPNIGCGPEWWGRGKSVRLSPIGEAIHWREARHEWVNHWGMAPMLGASNIDLDGARVGSDSPVLYCSWPRCTHSFVCVVEVGIEGFNLGAGPLLIHGLQVRRRRRVVGDATMECSIIKNVLKQIVVKLSIEIFGSQRLGSIAAGAGAGQVLGVDLFEATDWLPLDAEGLPWTCVSMPNPNTKHKLTSRWERYLSSETPRLWQST